MVPGKLLTGDEMYEISKNFLHNIHRSPYQLSQEIKEAWESMDSSACLTVEALNKATETPEITDLTFRRPTGPGSGQVNYLLPCT